MDRRRRTSPRRLNRSAGGVDALPASTGARPDPSLISGRAYVRFWMLANYAPTPAVERANASLTPRGTTITGQVAPSIR